MSFRLALAAILLAGAAQAAGVLDRIAETGAMRIGVRTDAPPLSYLDAETGEARGYTVALCRRLAERLAEQLGEPSIIVQPVPVTAEERFQAVADGRIDLLCGAASVTLARREIVDFSIPTYIDGASVLMRLGETADFAMLANRRIGVRGGTTTERSLLATLEKADMIADVVVVEAHVDGLARLLGRDIDAYFADQSILLFLAGSSGRAEELTVARNVLSVEPQALALPRGDDAFRLEVDRALSRMYRSGELSEIFQDSFAPATMGDAMKAMVLTAPLPE
jgi:polar amino acid transport system substrate-binding protein/glutamate/aspartate transport system substrate-binding protein